MITVKTNLPEFKSRLAELSRQMQNRIVRAATRASANVIRAEAKNTAPKREDRIKKKRVPGTKQIVAPGVLKASIGVVRKRSQRGTATYMVIPLSGERTRKGKSPKYQRDAYYWAWVEQGHVIATRRTRLPGGARRRALERERLRAAGRTTRPSWYLRRALQASNGRAVQAFYDSMERSFARLPANVR